MQLTAFQHRAPLIQIEYALLYMTVEQFPHQESRMELDRRCIMIVNVSMWDGFGAALNRNSSTLLSDYREKNYFFFLEKK